MPLPPPTVDGPEAPVGLQRPNSLRRRVFGRKRPTPAPATAAATSPSRLPHPLRSTAPAALGGDPVTQPAGSGRRRAPPRTSPPTPSTSSRHRTPQHGPRCVGSIVRRGARRNGADETQHTHRTRFRLQQIRPERMRRLQQPRGTPCPPPQPDLAQLLQAATELGQYQSRPVHARPAPRRGGPAWAGGSAIPNASPRRLASRRRHRPVGHPSREQSASQSRTRQLPPMQLLAPLASQGKMRRPIRTARSTNPLPVSTVDC